MKKTTLFIFLLNFLYSFGQDFTDNIQEVMSPNISSDGNFGWSVSLGQDFFAVGAPGEFNPPNTAGNIPTGAVYIFKKNGVNNWAQVQRFAPPDGDASDRFGTSVAIKGSYLVVGAHQHDITGAQNAGAAYVFELDPNNNYSILSGRKLVASDATTSDIFGITLDVFGDDIAIGAPNQDNGNVNTSNYGAIYIFRRQSNGDWLQVQKIISPDNLSGNENFGRGVALDNDKLLVGAAGANSLNGKAYIFNKNSSGVYVFEDGVIANSVNGPNNDFGFGLDLSNNNAVVGALRYDNNRGNIFAYEKNTSNQWNYVLDSETAIVSTSSNGFVGIDISINGNYSVVGAQTSIQSSVSTGKAVVIRKLSNAWTTVQELFPPASTDFNNGEFGRNVAIMGNVILVGTPKRNFSTSGFNDSGSVFIYETNSTLNLTENEITSGSISLYPNPVTNTLNVSGLNTKIDTFQVFNINGQKIKEYNNHSESYDVSDLSSGIYLVKIQSEKAIINAKFIKE